MPQPVVLVKHPRQGWLLIHRQYNQVVHLSDQEASEVDADEAIIRTSSSGVVSVSYELTEQCNVSCVHCYLEGVRSRSPLSLLEQQNIIDHIETSGAIWLQITGGEPLSCPTFKQVYSYAWDRGFLITVLTNGILLGRPSILSLFKDRPPFRVSVSIYGSSEETYERVTRRTGMWQHFQDGIRAAQTAGLHLRMKVIELKENAHELESMLKLAKSSDEYDHVSEIIPTLTGSLTPLSHQSSQQTQSECWSGCDAGVGSFHVTANGMACLCKIGRNPHVPLSEVNSLRNHSLQVLQTPLECQTCLKHSVCHVCPSLHRLLTMQGTNPCPRK